ncbi:MAG: hypothetical protein IPI06_15805 [Gammaproteobacteria bacterium]|nr:hypothetical protein [Gammaproteobacteria bacterium]
MSDAFTAQLDSSSLTAVLHHAGGELARRHEALWQAVWRQKHVPAPVLELCRLRLAQLHGAVHELEAPPPRDARERLDAAKSRSVITGSWVRESCLSPAERSALEFAEVYGQDPQAITDELAAAVKEHFGDAGLVALIEALGVIDGRIRLAMMLGALLPREENHE